MKGGERSGCPSWGVNVVAGGEEWTTKFCSDAKKLSHHASQIFLTVGEHGPPANSATGGLARFGLD